MKTLLTTLAVVATTATSAFAFDNTTSVAGLQAEKAAAEHVVYRKHLISIANEFYIASGRHFYQEAKEDFKGDYYGIGGTDKIYIDGVKTNIRDIPGLIDARIAVLEAAFVAELSALETELSALETNNEVNMDYMDTHASPAEIAAAQATLDSVVTITQGGWSGTTAEDLTARLDLLENALSAQPHYAAIVNQYLGETRAALPNALTVSEIAAAQAVLDMPVGYYYARAELNLAENNARIVEINDRVAEING